MEASTWILTSLFICFKVFVIRKVYKRYQLNLDLLHLFQTNLLCDLTVISMCNTILKSYGLEKLLPEFAANFYCSIVNLLTHFATLSSFCSLSILHYDRYQHLSLKSSYKSIYTVRTVKDKIISFKIICFLITILGFILDYEINHQCKKEPICMIIQKNDIIWSFIPYIISVGFIANVLWFAVKEKIKQEKEQSQLSTSRNESKIIVNASETGSSKDDQELENDTMDIESNRKIVTVSEIVSSSRMYPEDILDEDNIENDENRIEILDSENIEIQENRNEFKIIRREDMFYRVPVQEELSVHTNWRSFLSLDILRQMINEHKLTMCVAILNFQTMILQMYVYIFFTNSLCIDEKTLFLISGIFTFVIVNIYFVLSLLNI